MNHWNSEIAKEKLIEIKTHALDDAKANIDWYSGKKYRVGRWAKLIRILTITLLFSSTLMPLIATLPCLKDDTVTILYVGYFMAGLGGALLLADKFYGLSTSWIRFVLTSANLEDMRDSFIESWEVLYINNLPLTPKNFNTLAKYILDFSNIFNETIKTETEEWAREFQQNSNELMSALQKNMEDSKLKVSLKMNQLTSGEKDHSISSTDDTQDAYTTDDYVNMAIDQNQNFLYNKFKNIRLITHGRKMDDESGKLIDCVAIHLTNENSEGIPALLTARTLEGSDVQVETEVVESVDKPSVSYMAGDSVANSTINPLSKGNIACKIQMPDKTDCILTCCHVMTGGTSDSFSGNPAGTILGSVMSGTWFLGVRDAEMDIALIRDFDPDLVNFPNNLNINGHRELTIDDIKTTKVTMFGRLDFYAPPNGNGSAIDGYIINNRCVNPITISYNGVDCPMINLITISRTKQAPYESISQGGDSGSLIIDSATNEMVGIVIAQNSKFTYAISFVKVLKRLQIIK